MQKRSTKTDMNKKVNKTMLMWSHLGIRPTRTTEDFSCGGVTKILCITYYFARQLQEILKWRRYYHIMLNDIKIGALIIFLHIQKNYF